jgi:hypothetical protein
VGDRQETLREALSRGALVSILWLRQFLTNNWIFFLGFLLVVGLLVIGSIWDWDYWSELTFDKSHNVEEIRTDRARIIQQILLVIGGTAAFILAAWRTWTAHRQAGAALDQVKVALRQADLAERAHNIDRYTRAANMLDSDKVAVRQAAVYTLFELGRADSANFYNLVIRLLASFARVRSVEFKRQEAEKEHERGRRQYSFPSPTDKPVIQTDETVEFSDLYDAISSIGWLREQQPDGVRGERTAKFTLNLTRIVGARRGFTGVNFSAANLRGADLTGSLWTKAEFRHTDLRYVDFHGAKVRSSDFANALFQNTDLELAEFEACNFEGVSFASAAFKKTKFDDCNISDVHFEGAEGLTDAMINESWAWKDKPPHLPSDVGFTNYFEQGPNGEYRDGYRKMMSGALEFSAPE